MNPRVLLFALGCALAAGCRQDMHDQPRYEPLERSLLFDDLRSARPQVAGTVARGELWLDEHLYRGLVDGEPAPSFPFPIDEDVIARGKERYEVFCAPCHDRTGYGRGMVVQRGSAQPPSFHVERLREAPPGYFFDVITNGFGKMFGLAERVPPRDRWAIVAYLRALQASQHAPLEAVPAAERRFLEGVR